jgi:hypothetical protein
MQSSTRRWPARSSSPDSVNGVGAMGKIPAKGVDLALEVEDLTRLSPASIE